MKLAISPVHSSVKQQTRLGKSKRMGQHGAFLREKEEIEKWAVAGSA
jgi:hypothetical protein